MSPSGDARTLDALALALGESAERDATLRAFTTFRIGGPADVLVRAHTVSDLARVSAAIDGFGDGALEVLVVGQGSNLLIGDDGFRGLVVVLTGEFETITIGATADGSDPQANTETGTGTVTAGGAVKLPVLARQTVAAGLRGLEWMVGVPGSVGGAVRMNAGGHGSDVASGLRSASLFALRAGPAGAPAGLRVVAAEALALRYRSSSVAATDVVVDATFALEPGDRAAGEQELSEIVRWRRAHQPGGANCGSVFTNPPGDSAGRLIDAAGLKGFRVGTAEISHKHANFIQADEGASAADVWNLIVEVRHRVHDAFGVVLHPEVRTAGFAARLAPLTAATPFLSAVADAAPATADFPPRGAST